MRSSNLIKFFLLLLPVLTSTQAKGDDNQSLETYYRDVYLGERKTVNYSGPLDPRSHFNDRSGSLVFFDDSFKDEYMNTSIQEEPFLLYRYWFTEVVEKSTCPDVMLGENIDYIRYLYRLVSMSYLFEGLKLSHKLSSELGVKNSCSITFKDIFGNCAPVSDDMKKFHERIYGKFINEIEKSSIGLLSKNEQRAKVSNFQNSNSLSSDPVFARLHDWCIANKKNCRTLTSNDISEALSGFCSKDTKALKLLCSEKDSLYGLAGVSTPTDLIKSSNAFNLINQSGMGEECLRRYGKVFQTKEIGNPVLSRQYPLIYSGLLKSGSRYPQGELFLPGSLKEFDMKGLSDFLTALKPPKAPVITVVKPKPKPKPKPVVVVEAPKVVLEEKKPDPPPIAVIEPTKPYVSEFEKSVELLSREKGMSSISIDMDIFRDDFEFTSEMIAELSGPIKKFQTRAALNDMKAYDKLGGQDAPLGLIFLKFLIDTENHQGLYNIITVLGDKFYVVNDIEKKTDSHYMQLKNDTSTGNRWQITLLKK